MLTDEQIDGFADRAFADYMQDKNDDRDYAFARAVEAATLATVTPLVQQLVDALENERLRAPHRKIGLWGPARHAARAFLSGATKESNHG